MLIIFARIIGRYLFSLTGKKSNDDSPYSPSLKRRRADDVDDDDVSFSYSNISCNSTLNSSNQWEVRILKADLIEANTKVSCCFFSLIIIILSSSNWFQLVTNWPTLPIFGSRKPGDATEERGRRSSTFA